MNVLSAITALADDCAALCDVDALESLADALRLSLDLHCGVGADPNRLIRAVMVATTHDRAGELWARLWFGDRTANKAHATLAHVYLCERIAGITARMDGSIAEAISAESFADQTMHRLRLGAA